MKHTVRWASWLRLLVVVPLFAAASAFAQDAKPFSKEQLDQMLAPIALYPDSLLSQVLMASTYPADVAEAVAWSKANPKQTGDAAVKAVESKPWDPSVQSLVAFPQALAMMGEKPDWVQTLGDAFLAQPEDVMNSVQTLRAAAQKSGNLKTTEQQKVIVEQAPTSTQQTIIKIEPAQPQVVYVPVYNPTVVYGSWWYPSYPPYYWPTPGYTFGTALMSGIAFGTGIAITNALWGGFNWGRGDVDINVNRYNNINVNRQINANQNNVSWKHNSDNRRGTPYRDDKTRQQFDRKVAGAEGRADYRGKDASRDASREKAQAAMKDRGVDPAKGREQLKSDPQVRDRAQQATQNVDRDRARDAAQNVDRDKARQAAQGVDRGEARAKAQNVDRDAARAKAQNVDRSQARQTAQNRAPDNAFKGASNPAQSRKAIDRGTASRNAAATRAAAPRASAGGGGGGRAAARGGGGGGGRMGR
jgi:hypothetical protein